MKGEVEHFLLNHALVNLLILMLPVFLYQLSSFAFFDRPLPLRRLFWLAPISIVVCMSYPIALAGGMPMDLRQVYVLLGTLYGGWRVTLLLAATALGFQFLLWQGGYATSIGVAALPIALAFFLRKKFHAYGLAGRFAVSGSLIALNSCMIFFFTGNGGGSHSSVSLIEYIIFALFSTFLVQYFIHTTERNVIMKEQLLAADRLKIVSQIAASVSHEIRNPMAVIGGFVQLMSRQEVPRDKQLTYLAQIEEELDRSQSILNDYLALAKTGKADLQILRIDEEFAYVRNVITPYANMHNVEIRCEIHSNLPFLCDRNEFRQAMINLCKNAIEAMPDGGTLTMTASDAGRVLYLRLKDTGIGMDKKQIEQIGTPFYTNKAGGTGLGMIIVGHMLKTVGGKMTVVSEVGKGSTFTIAIPV
ncbi:ATP-binding protein [Paenibacillus sp. TRM 82003]|nr:ATP-binding protein [Paenibacillus sp. TRM 82003]